jgi:hypothetical protein
MQNVLALELAYEQRINEDVRAAAAATAALAASRAAEAESAAEKADERRRGVEEDLTLIRGAVLDAEASAARAAAECGKLQSAVLVVKQVWPSGLHIWVVRLLFVGSASHQALLTNQFLFGGSRALWPCGVALRPEVVWKRLSK